MVTDRAVWIGGLVASALLLVFLVLSLGRWQTSIDRYTADDGSSSSAELETLRKSMSRARLTTLCLALLALIPATPAVFAMILRYPKMHAILSIGGIVFILVSAGKALVKLDLGVMFPSRPSKLALARSAGIGLCAGFVLLLILQIMLDEHLLKLVIDAWKAAK